MLKKLKRKFILTNMILVGITVLFIFAAVCVLTYRSESEQLNRTLEQALLLSGKNGSFADGERHENIPQLGSNTKFPYVYAYSVIVDNDGHILVSNSFGTSIDDEILQNAVDAVLSDNKHNGVLADSSLMYSRQSIPEGTVIAFASTERLKTTLNNTALIAGIACAVSLLIFFLISQFLAKIAIKPIEHAWTQQKQFIADASHDLKTPITVILANTDILKSHKNEKVGEQIKWIESAAEEASRMRELTDKMLELAKSEDIKERIILEQINISELTERVLLQFEPVAFEKKVEIHSGVLPDIIVNCHESSYVRLAHILIDNAIKYSPEGTSVSVSVTQSKQNVTLLVENSGDVIPDEDLPHIFERFYRADKARGIGGHGLGLSIAKNLAEAIGGKISVQSSEQAGTVFAVTFNKIR